MRDATATASPRQLPALVQQFFTEYLVAQRALSPRTVACYRDAMTLFLGFAAQHAGQVAKRTAADGHHAGVDPGVPGSPGARAAQLGAQPQPAADRAAGVPEVRRPARRDGAARRRAGAGRADEALRAAAAGPPDARGDDRRAGAARHRMDLAARPSAAGHALQHRRARLRDHRGARRRRGAGRGRLRASARQGPQGALGAAVEVHRAEIRAWLRPTRTCAARRHCCPIAMACR